MQKSLVIAVGTGVLFAAGLMTGPVMAQTAQTTTQTTQTTDAQTGNTINQYNPYCGAWVNGAFAPNGNCVTETITTTTTMPADAAPANGMAGGTTAMAAMPKRFGERVSGKIIAVNKNLVTLQHGDRTLIVNDGRALNREDTGHVATGRDVIAHGYWEDGTFYANRFE